MGGAPPPRNRSCAGGGAPLQPGVALNLGAAAKLVVRDFCRSSLFAGFAKYPAGITFAPSTRIPLSERLSRQANADAAFSKSTKPWLCFWPCEGLTRQNLTGPNFWQWTCSCSFVSVDGMPSMKSVLDWRVSRPIATLRNSTRNFLSFTFLAIKLCLACSACDLSKNSTTP